MPDPITSRLFPITSDKISESTAAGYASAASQPPLMLDRCFLTVFISLILAPELSSRRVVYCFISSVIGCAGNGSNAEAPPEMTQMIKSSSVAEATIPAIVRAPSTPASSGTG